MSTVWQEHWRRIVARIEGLSSAVRIIIDSQQASYFGITGYFHEQWNDIFQEMKQFFATHAHSVPSPALACFEAFCQKRAAVITAKDAGNAPSRLAYLVGLRAELDYLLADNDLRTKRIAERAFIHLQRTIVADEEVRKKWQTAFNKDEESCERLGAAHLIHHALWAFKANATTGGRTDLILGSPPNDDESARKALDGLVLTEWKLVKKPAEAANIASIAVTQCELYTTGILAGFELTSTRYIVLVSDKALAVLPDTKGKTATYRHVNISVNPDVPSVAAKATTN